MALSGADTIVIDLRKAASHAVDGDFRKLAVNGHQISALLPAVDSPAMPRLLDSCVASNVTTVILSGARNGADLQHLDVLLQVSEARAGAAVGATRIIAMIGDNPHGLLAAASFADKSARLAGLAWDKKTLAATMRLKNGLGPDVTARTRATLLLAATAANVAAIDTAEHDGEGGAFQQSCRHARAEGFVGKMTDLPSQLPVIRSVFSD